MTVYAWGLTYSDVDNELGPGVTIDSTSTPTSTQVTSLLQQYSGEINGILRGDGCSPSASLASATSTEDVHSEIKRRVLEATVGRVMRWRGGTGNETAKEFLTAWNDWIDQVRKIGPRSMFPTLYGLLAASHATDDVDDQLGSDEDYYWRDDDDKPGRDRNTEF